MHSDVMAIIVVLFSSITVAIERCNVKEIEKMSCPVNETCVESDPSSPGTCRCSPGYERIGDGSCEKAAAITKKTRTDPESSISIDEAAPVTKTGTHVTVGMVMAVILVAFVICGIYTSRKYSSLAKCIRTKLHRRNDNCDGVVIGGNLDDDDDPPLD